MKIIVHFTCTILFPALVLCCCKHVTIDDADNEVLSEVKTSIQNEINFTEERMLRVLFTMRKDVRESGQRQSDLYLLNEAFEIFRKYKQVQNIIDSFSGKVPYDTISSILNKFVNTFPEYAGLFIPVSEYNYFTNEHIKLDLALEVMDVIQNYSFKIYGPEGFDMIVLAVINYPDSDSVKLFMTTILDSELQIDKVSFTPQHRDVLDPDDFGPWTNIHFTGDQSPAAVVTYYDNFGIKQEKSFSEMVETRLYYRSY